MYHSPDRNRFGFDVDEAFADPAFASPRARGAAFAVVRPGDAAVLWANAAAALDWGRDPETLRRALFGAPEAGAAGGWLGAVARGTLPGRPPRLARTRPLPGLELRSRTLLVRAWTTHDGATLLGLAAADVPPRPDVPEDAWRRDACPAPAPLQPRQGDAAPDEGEPSGDAGQTLARRGMIAVLRDRLNQAFDGAATLRLLWRTDAGDAVTQIDRDGFARLGTPPWPVGAPLPVIAAGFDPAGGERLRAALGSRATWSGVMLKLPVAGDAALVPMMLSASPVFGTDRAFAGFRGFGTIDLGGLDLAPTRAEPAPGEDIPAPAWRKAAVPDDPAAAEPPAPPAAVEDAPPPAVEPPASAANVVHLRAFQAMASGRLALPAPPAVEASPAQGPAPVPARPDPAERDAPLADDMAFKALGEALRARIAAPPGDRDEPPRPEPRAEAGDALPKPPRVPGPGDAAARLLDQLPLALLATVGETPVFANAAAARLLGHASAEEALDTGGLTVSPTAQPGTVALRDGRGQVVILTARRESIAWEGSAATLWMLAEAPRPAAEPRPLPEARPEEGETRSGELLDRIDDAVALLDGEGHIRRLNRRGENWFGAPGGEAPMGGEAAVGQSFTHLLAPESRPAALSLLDEVRAQKDVTGARPLHRDVMARTSEAQPVPMLLTMGRLGAAGFYATLRDVSALRRAEVESERARDERARGADRLPDLLEKVSHEIRTPLNAILGFAEVMMDERFGPLGNPRYKDYLRDIHASGTQIVALVSDLLDLSRIEAGQLTLDLAAVDVNRIVAEMVAQMQPEAHRERVIMRTSLAPRIPSVLADERSTRQIVQNLLSNAVRFNEPGGQVIVSTALGEGGTVVLRVRDTGVGMSDDEIAAALEPFHRGSAPHPANGNGLGLPLTRALVGANGASIAIRSRPREGTLVEVAFTSAPPEDARLPA